MCVGSPRSSIVDSPLKEAESIPRTLMPLQRPMCRKHLCYQTTRRSDPSVERLRKQKGFCFSPRSGSTGTTMLVKHRSASFFIAQSLVLFPRLVMVSSRLRQLFELIDRRSRCVIGSLRGETMRWVMLSLFGVAKVGRDGHCGIGERVVLRCKQNKCSGLCLYLSLR